MTAPDSISTFDCCVIEVGKEMALGVRCDRNSPLLRLAADHATCAGVQARALLVPKEGGGLARLDLATLPQAALLRLFKQLRARQGVALFALDGQQVRWRLLGTLTLAC